MNEYFTVKKVSLGKSLSFWSMIKIAISIVIFICVCIVYNQKHESTIEKAIFEKQIAELIGENEVLVKDHTKNLEEMNSLVEEMNSLKQRLEGINNSEDLLRRDIFLYIDKKFQLIPKSLAADIAIQIVAQAKAAAVSPELIVGIIEVESSFNPMAVSSKNARGLMQVMPEWAPKFNLKKVSDLHDVDTNIISGIKVLKIHIDEANGSITNGLYRYVGKSDAYSTKVYAAMGKFVAFRSTLNNDKNDKDEEETENKEEGSDNEKSISDN